MKQSIASLLSKSPHILVVDDDIEQLSQIVDWLKPRNGKLFQARSSEQAQKILTKEWISAVITDWQLPEMSGLDLIQYLRAQEFSGPLLLCTGMMLSPKHLQMAFDAGASDYLRKPLNGVELNARLDNALQLFGKSETLRLLNCSQQRFIDFLAQDLGEDIQHLARTQRFAPDPEVEREITQNMGEHFQNLMEWARYRFALQHIEPRKFELTALLQSLEHHYQAHWKRVKIRGAKNLVLFSDPDILYRILYQLVDNALYHTQGSVIIQLNENEQELQFSVKDDGLQSTEGDLERLMQPKFQGLGLVICHDLLALLNSKLYTRRSRTGENVFSFSIRHV